MKRTDFVISVLNTDHGSWQGTIYWAQTDKKMCFRSSLELLKLIDSAVSTNGKAKTFKQQEKK